MLNDEWRKSQRCDTSACVEVRRKGEFVQIRDTKNPDGPVLSYTENEWLTFLEDVKNGEFDL